MLVTRDPSNTLGKRSKRVLKVGGQVLSGGIKNLPTPSGSKRKNNINFNPKVGRFNVKPKPPTF